MRPVARNYIRYHELFDGTYNLSKIADLNDMIDVMDENTYRAQQPRTK